MKLIQPNSLPPFGVLPNTISEVNYLDYDLRTPMDRKRGGLAKRMGFNQFHFVGLNTPELMAGIAIVDLKLVGNAFAYCFDKQTGEYEEFSFLSPLAIGTEIESSPNAGKSTFKQGKNQFCIEASKDQRRVSVSLKKGLKIDLLLDESTFDQKPMMPLSLCCRAGYQGWVFTQKANALKVSGNIHWQNKSYTVDDSALASVDFSCGYMRRETAWNWGSLSCYLKDGRRLGFNLAAGVNETGTSENILWIDDHAIKIDMVDFRFDRYDHSVIWEMKSGDGIIDIRFKPVGQRSEKIHAGIIASNFTQHFGQFSGQIHLPDETIELEDAWGFAEDHYAKW